MPGIPHNPKADIQLIRGILHAGYEDGFPVLKELLQNADDAGAGDPDASASTVVILLAPGGLPGATHSLLCQRPALCVLNDGDFRRTDARCLPMLGLSNKATERMSVGKFGIGLKTVFYLTDAFVFFCNQRQHWSEEEKACDLVNPWAEKHRPAWEDDWKNTADHEQQQLQCLARERLGVGRFLGIWIPLRRNSDAQPEVIHNYYPGESFDAIFGQKWAQRLLEFAPLLRHVRTISARRLLPDGSCEEIVHIGPRPTADCHFVQLANGTLHGELALRHGQDASQSVHFHGVETLGNPELTQRFQESRNWPRQAAFDETTDQPERATPHGAVVFTRRPAFNGAGRVQVQHAVFLPLGDADQLPLPGKWDYSVFLHGFYFVGSSRRHIEAFDPQSDHRESDALPNLSEAELRRAWNCQLTAELICPGFVPALAGFVDRVKATGDEVSGLVRALAKSEVLKSYPQWLYAHHQFLFRLDQNGGAWKAEAIEPALYVIPAPQFPFQQLLTALPSLQRIAAEQVVTLKGTPLLSSKKPTRLPDKLLAELLAGVPGTVFDHKEECRYLLDLITEDADTSASTSALTQALVRLANGQVIRPLPEDQELSTIWKELFQCLPAKAFIQLPCDSTKVAADISALLAKANLPVAVLWQDFRDAQGQGTVTWECLLPVLRSLGRLPLTTEVAVLQRSNIAVRLLKACAVKPTTWAEPLANSPIFHARLPASRVRAASITDLNTANVETRLFTTGEKYAGDLLKAAPDRKPLLIDEAVAETTDLPLRDCGAAECAKLLRAAPRLAKEFAARKLLFDRLLGHATKNTLDTWAALRCLLHGQVSQWENTASLLRESSEPSVFTLVAKRTLHAAGQPWRLIPKHTGDQLRLDADHQHGLNLVSLSAAHVEALVEEAGPENVDCTDLSREDCDILLRQFNDVTVLRRLNIHDTLDNHRVRIGEHTYVDDGSFTNLPREFDGIITRIKDNPNYSRFTDPNPINRLVAKLSWEAVIEIALDQNQPTAWAATILTAIGHLGNLRSELKQRVQEVAWLPLTSATAVAPNALLHVPGAAQQLDELSDDILDGHIPVLRLEEPVRQHERFETFKTAILPQAKEALVILANLLQPHAGWSTGLSDDWSAEQTLDWLRALGDTQEQALPLPRLVKAIHGEPSVRPLLSGLLQILSGQLTEAAYSAALRHLARAYQAADAEARPKVECVFLRYLKAIDGFNFDFARRVLESEAVQLISAANQWKPARQLAPPTEGLSAADMVNEKWAEALPGVVAECRRADPPQKATDAACTSDNWPAAAKKVRRFLEPWRQHLPSPDPIGALLSIFSSPEELANTAHEYFGSNRLDTVRQWIQQQYPDLLSQLDNEFKRHEPRIEVQRGTTILVRSLVGTQFDATRDQNPTTLILGGDPRMSTGQETQGMHPGPAKWVLRLLPVNPTALSVSDAVHVLQAATEQVIERVLDKQVNLTALFDRLSQASQVEVQVAQSLVVESALGLLRQIGGHAHPGIKEALAQWDDARREEAAAELLGIHEQKRAQEKRRASQQQIRRLLEKDADAHRALLAEVKEKLEKYYGYDPSSVPFELWQNADDALTELDQLTKDVTRSRAAGFVVVVNQDDVAFVHFGRLINEFRRPGGHNREDLGFSRDLEKMVVQYISDKIEAGHRSGAALTGKFGLGFKSVFLVTDAPEVLSGSLDFVIRGGIYPTRLEADQRDHLLGVLRNLAPNDWRQGTIIRLPLKNQASPNSHTVLDSFRRLAPLLVAFSRRLKRLRFLSHDKLDAEISWRPRELRNGIKFGALHGIPKTESALVLSRRMAERSDRLQFLMGMNADGFVPLPEDVPVFWVTAPTRATPGYGFAVNGPFEPDVGRVGLKEKSDRNRQLADELACLLSGQLKILWKQTSHDWPQLRGDLNLAKATSTYDFWETLWASLGRHFASRWRPDNDSPPAVLSRRILWGSEADGLRSFYDECAALPSGLCGDDRTLIRLPDVRYIAAGALDREKVFKAARGWPSFRKRAPLGSICSAKHVASILEVMGVPFSGAAALYLANAVEWELGPTSRADPGLADRLGQLITPDFLKHLQGSIPEDAEGRDEREHAALTTLLPHTEFKSESGSWQKPSKLLVTASQRGLKAEEAKRAAFAPQESRLDPAYTKDALEFFFASRPYLQVDVETMAEWVTQAATVQVRVAALRYLLEGDLKEQLAETLRARRDDGNWLWRLDDQPWFKGKFTAEERHQLFAYVLRLFDQELRDRSLPPPPPPPSPPPAAITIWTVRQLWDWWQENGMPKAEYTLEGEPNWPLFHGGPIASEQERQEELKRLLLSPSTSDGKALWYRLFGYACLVSAGRYMTELRRFWIQRLDADQFWTLTSNGDFSDRTRDIFERAVTAEFTNMSAGGEQAYFWRRVFYDIRKVHRMVWVNDFPVVLMELVERGHAEHLPQFLRTGHLPGPDQPRWVGTFGQSAATPLRFLIRELFRLRVITDEKVRPFAFYVCRPVLRALWKIGWIQDEDEGFSGDLWLAKLNEDPVCGQELLLQYDIPLLHMGITHRGGRMPVPPRQRL